MNDLWPIETLCIIIIVDYAKSKINEALNVCNVCT